MHCEKFGKGVQLLLIYTDECVKRLLLLRRYRHHIPKRVALQIPTQSPYIMYAAYDDDPYTYGH